MSRALLVLAGDKERQKATAWVANAPVNTRVEFKRPRRTLPQNDRMWAMLTDVAQQAEWAGKRRTPEQWKDLFTASFQSARNGLEIVPGLNGGFMIFGLHTSDLSKEEMGELMDWMEAWAAENGVTFTHSEGPAGAKNPSGIAA